MNLLQLLQSKFQAALTGLVDDPSPYASQVKPAQDARFGDYQANCAMPLAKVLGRKPRDIAQEIVGRLALDNQLEPPEVAGPGFINLRFRSDWLAGRLQEMARDERLGVPLAQPPRTIVIDYSSPNVAKPMHVGHLRSTIIGDSLARLFRFLGHRVIADNHLGDWGLQFGMLLYGYKHFRDEAALKADPVREMARLYIEVRKLIDPAEQAEEKPELARKYAVDELARSRAVLAEARQETAKLHAGDADNCRLWNTFMPWCLAEIEPIYRRLDIKFDATLGESFYQPMLPDVVRDLLQSGVARESKGAVAIFFGREPGPAEEVKESEPPPAVIRTAHGTFTYTTSDLATIRHRMQTWQPDAILYVVDFRQKLHFQNLFEAAKRWGYQGVELVHVSFGSVLGRDRKPIKTREGGGVELSELLDQGVRQAARAYLDTRQERIARGEDVPEVSESERQQIAEAVGIGAVKYADLSQNRESDYVFDWDKMLAMDGNTATYMQYAYARIRSIFRKGGLDESRFRAEPPRPNFVLSQERELALQLLRFPEALQAAAVDYKPNAITSYLWDLAKSYSGFYQSAPVLKAETPALRQSRLLLCDLTARVIQKGLDLLGIRTIERM
jgi:arginyl-tRNA synthetase